MMLKFGRCYRKMGKCKGKWMLLLLPLAVLFLVNFLLFDDDDLSATSEIVRPGVQQLIGNRDGNSGIIKLFGKNGNDKIVNENRLREQSLDSVYEDEENIILPKKDSKDVLTDTERHNERLPFVKDAQQYHKNPFPRKESRDHFGIDNKRSRETGNSNSVVYSDDGVRPGQIDQVVPMVKTKERKPNEINKTETNVLLKMSDKIARNISITSDIILYKSEVPPQRRHYLQNYQDNLVAYDPNYANLPNLTTALRPKMTCGIIGDGKSLTQSLCGQKIDATSFVMRTSLLTSHQDTSADIGKKTDLAFMNKNLLSKLENALSGRDRRKGWLDSSRLTSFNTSIFFYPWRMERKSKERQQLRRVVMRLSQLYNINLKMAFSPNKPFNLKVNEFWKIPTSNDVLTLITLSLGLCQDTTVYGVPISKEGEHGEGNIALANVDILLNELAQNKQSDVKDPVNIIINYLHRAGILHIVNNCTTP